MNAIDFHGRAVIVTGAGNGLGRSYALELARRGAAVVVNDLGTSTSGEGCSVRSADRVLYEIQRAGGRAVASHDSVASGSGCEAIAARCLEAFGRIDAVVHNAGILRNAPFDKMTNEQFFPVLGTHLVGAYLLTRAVYPTMRDQGYGRLVFTSSSSGLFGRTNGANYAAAKAGVIGLCNALALEGAPHGVLANAVLPVAMTRLGGAPDAADTSPDAAARRAELREREPRMAPEWVTPLVIYLASEACSVTHRYYSAINGRYARVFVGVTAGWRAPDEGPPTAEQLRDRLGDIEDREDHDLPESTFDEIELVARRATLDTSPSSPTPGEPAPAP